jgi:hypothetical protein
MSEQPVLFEWRSDMLRRYSQGFILVVAPTVEQARDIARQNLGALLRERYDYLYDYDGDQPLDDDSGAQLEEYRTTFEADIANEPTIRSEGVVFVLGSE